MTCPSGTWKKVKGSSPDNAAPTQNQSCCLLLELGGTGGYDPERRAGVLTASPGGTAVAQTRGLLHCPPAVPDPSRSHPGWHLKQSAQHPNPTRPGSRATSSTPPATGGGIKCQRAQDARQPLRLPCLPASGRNRREKQRESPSTPPSAGAPERPRPGRAGTACLVAAFSLL